MKYNVLSTSKTFLLLVKFLKWYTLYDKKRNDFYQLREVETSHMYFFLFAGLWISAWDCWQSLRFLLPRRDFHWIQLAMMMTAKSRKEDGDEVGGSLHSLSLTLAPVWRTTQGRHIFLKEFFPFFRSWIFMLVCRRYQTFLSCQDVVHI